MANSPDLVQMSDENRPALAVSARAAAPLPAELKTSTAGGGARPALKELNLGQPSGRPTTPSRFDAVRALDEEENWRDRTEVITKEDHALNKQLARDILHQIVDSAASTPTDGSSSLSFATVSSNPPLSTLPVSCSLPDVVRAVADPRASDSGDSEYESASEHEAPELPVSRSETSLLADQLQGLALQTPARRGAAPLGAPPADPEKISPNPWVGENQLVPEVEYSPPPTPLPPSRLFPDRGDQQRSEQQGQAPAACAGGEERAGEGERSEADAVKSGGSVAVEGDTAAVADGAEQAHQQSAHGDTPIREPVQAVTATSGAPLIEDAAAATELETPAALPPAETKPAEPTAEKAPEAPVPAEADQAPQSAAEDKDKPSVELSPQPSAAEPEPRGLSPLPQPQGTPVPETPITASSPPIRSTSPPIRGASPPVRSSSPPIRSASPPIGSASPPIRAGSPPVGGAAAAGMTQTGEEDDLPIPPKKGYNLDFLDDPNFDPFNTGSSIKLSPPGSPKASLPPLKPAKTKKQRDAEADNPAAEKGSEAEDGSGMSNGVNEGHKAEDAPAAPPAKKPPQKKVARPVKRPLKKKPPPVRAEPDKDATADTSGPGSGSPPLASKPGAYNLDFLDHCDDPNFNPFATKSAMTNSPPGSPKLPRPPVAASPPPPVADDEEKEQESPPPPAKPTARKPLQKRTPKKKTPPPADAVKPAAAETAPDPTPVASQQSAEPSAAAAAEISASAASVDDTDTTAGQELTGVSVAETESLGAVSEVLEDPLGGGDSALVHGDDSRKDPSAISLLDTAPLVDTMGISGAAAASEMADGDENFVPAAEFFHDPAQLDQLAAHCQGRLASNIARNSLFVKFDPLLGRPSVLPEVQRLAGAQAEQDPAPPVVRQVSAVKQNLIAFSPGKEAEAPQPATAAPLAAETDNSAAAVPADGAQQGNVLKQNLSLQDQLLKRDVAITTMKKTIAEQEKQIARNNKALELYEVALTYLSGAKERQCGLLTERVRELTAERDEAREEVANIEAMFADLHRKYEKSKSVVGDHRQRGEQLSGGVRERDEQVDRETARYDLLQKYTEDAMERLRADLDASAKAQETEILRLTMKLKLSDNRASKLEDDNQQLTAMCDELIQKMGDQR